MANRTVAFGQNTRKRSVAWALALVAANYLLEFLVGLTFVLLLRRDPILTAVPAILALPGIVAQPWFLLVMVSSAVLEIWPVAPLIASLITLAVYRALDRQGSLEGTKAWFRRLQSPRGFAKITVLLAALGVVAFVRYHDIPPRDRGIPYDVEDEVSALDLAPRDSLCYCLGAFVDAQWLWQARMSERDFRALGEQLDLHPVDVAEVGPEFLHQPPFWWRPVLSERILVLGTEDLPIAGHGNDGWHRLATWEPDGQVMHMWIQDNMP